MIFTLDKLKFQIIFPSVSLKTQSRLNVSNIIFLLVVNDLIREEVFVFIWSNDFLHDPSRKDQRRGYLRKSLSICLTLTAFPILFLTCHYVCNTRKSSYLILVGPELCCFSFRRKLFKIPFLFIRFWRMWVSFQSRIEGLVGMKAFTASTPLSNGQCTQPMAAWIEIHKVD